jgi:ribosomal protein S18 acetylase RimI-like enzyme
MRVARLKKDDVSEFLRLVHSTIRSFPYFTDQAKNWQIEIYTKRRIDLRLKRRSYIILAAKEHDQIVGFALAYLNAGVAYLEWIGVAPLYRRSGIASLLLKEIERQIIQKQAHKVSLHVLAKNRPSNTFFKKHEYRLIGRQQKHWFKLDFTLYEKLVE